MSNQQGFLFFLKEICPGAAMSAEKMEALIYRDPSSAVLKARVFAEELISQVLSVEGIDETYLANFYERILYLSRDGIITPTVQKYFDTIRLTGNRAAHNANFDDIISAFKLHRVMYDLAVWFCEVYTSEEPDIPPYRRPAPPNEAVIDKRLLQELIKEQLSGLIPRREDEGPITPTTPATEAAKPSPVPDGGLLLREFRKLQESSKEAVENANELSQLKQYLHVDRAIQRDLESVLENGVHGPSLVLLCGSVGDGKSHLLARLKEQRAELLRGYDIFNDATESFSPSKSSLETLDELLVEFSDQRIDGATKRVILAINMGVLHNFLSATHAECSYGRLTRFVTNSGLFSSDVTTYYAEASFSLLSFADYHQYELSEDGPHSTFFQRLLDKLVAQNIENPFYNAYQQDTALNMRTMVHENYEFLQNKRVQDQIVNLTVQAMIKHKLVVSARAFLNFIADIVIPPALTPVHLLNDTERLELALPTLLFERDERSDILRVISKLDPIHRRSPESDQLRIEIYTLGNAARHLVDMLGVNVGAKWVTPFFETDGLTDETLEQLSEALIRLAFLVNESFASSIDDGMYLAYTKALYDINFGNLDGIKRLYDHVRDAFFKWKGSPLKEYAYFDSETDTYRLGQRVTIKPYTQDFASVEETQRHKNSFRPTIILGYQNGHLGRLELDIDYQLYSLLQRVRRGYRPSKKDEEEAVKFVEFSEKIMAGSGAKQNELLVHFISDGVFYKLATDDFGTFVFERGD